jgi:hypothetical protein
MDDLLILSLELRVDEVHYVLLERVLLHLRLVNRSVALRA